MWHGYVGDAVGPAPRAAARPGWTAPPYGAGDRAGVDLARRRFWGSDAERFRGARLRRPLKFGTPEFDRTCDFVRGFYGAAEQGERRRWELLFTEWWRATQTFAAVLRLPVVDLQFSATPAGQALDGFYRRRRLLLPTGRLAQAVLDLRESREDYLRGRSRQALRTNARAAAARGITCEVRQAARWWTDAASVRAALPLPEVPADVAEDALLLAVATGPDGTTIAIASVLLDRRVGWLLTLATSGRSRAEQAAKYLLHLHVVDELRRRGVTHLWAGDALYAQRNIQYIQHILGFTPVNLRRRRPAP